MNRFIETRPEVLPKASQLKKRCASSWVPRRLILKEQQLMEKLQRLAGHTNSVAQLIMDNRGVGLVQKGIT